MANVTGMRPTIEKRHVNHRFRIADALVLCVAAAIAFAIVRVYGIEPGLPLYGLFAFQAVGRSLTLTLAVLVVLRSRPIRDAAESSGKLAVLTVSAAMLFDLCCLSAFFLPGEHFSTDTFGERWEGFLELVLFHRADFDIPAVASIAALISHRLLRTRSQRRDWMDATGVLIAWFWILGALASPFVYWLDR